MAHLLHKRSLFTIILVPIWYLFLKNRNLFGPYRDQIDVGMTVGHTVLTRDMEDRVIPDVMNHVFLPQGRYPENFVPISQLEGCQEGGNLEEIGGS